MVPAPVRGAGVEPRYGRRSMELPVAERRCRWCGRRFPIVPGPGRPREFCRRSCRQRDYEARQRAAEVGLSEHELVLTRQAVDDLRDRIYVLECAVEDVQGDLQGSPSVAELRDAIDWLLDAARPVIDALGRATH